MGAIQPGSFGKRVSIYLVMAGQKREARLRARCPGHPRFFAAAYQDVDARHKAGHDD